MRSDDRELAGSNPSGATWKLGKFVYPTLPVYFGCDTITHWSLLSGVYTRGSKRSHPGVNV